MKRLRLLLVVLAVFSACGVREVHCVEVKLADGSVCYRCITHNNWSGNDSEPAVSCPRPQR